ncbi:MAG: SDR family oxidoreductase [Nanoarchaeota archaeon]|nr:SDR family oxidoreductase [Nanoarchaeota archaeon]MBU1005408.1 SDR family oxidoreductase [Nanoarchaeota archaeon]MBU1946952.1 SDR family oxidoreductase [Nanoarchaeota archaeon]
MDKIFMTGGTGFSGSIILKALLQNKEIETIWVLIRDEGAGCKQLFKSIGKMNHKKKIVPIKGDITSPNFGLSNSELQDIQSADEVYHLAANTSLSNEEGKKKHIFDTNIKGTRNLLEIFKDARHLKKLFYFSSAYSCGKASGTIKEAWLDKPSQFRNYYEESKWLSEDLIRQYHHKYNLPFIILRPSIISCGDQFQPENSKIHTIYHYGHILKKAYHLQKKKHYPIALVGKPHSTLNIMPIEDITKLLLEIRGSGKINMIFNLTNEINCTLQSVLGGIQEGIGFMEGYILKEGLDFSSLSDSERFAFLNTRPFWEYALGSNLRWAVENTKEMRMKLGLNAKDNKWVKEHLKRYFINVVINEKQKSAVQI